MMFYIQLFEKCSVYVSNLSHFHQLKAGCGLIIVNHGAVEIIWLSSHIISGKYNCKIGLKHQEFIQLTLTNLISEVKYTILIMIMGFLLDFDNQNFLTKKK